MNQNINQIHNKKITGVVIREHNSEGVYSSQLFLVFNDYSCYEFYCYDDDIRPTNGIWPNASFDHVSSYMKENYFMAYQAVIDPDSGQVAFESRDRV
ncbi:MAG: hypothetical protein OQL06_05810 [Gammaproteobacteria bacterium]|nr:hypothetical protein [Gammaproteobacteria bacterium]